MPDRATDLVRRLLRDDCPPFALLRRRTPGRDHDTVEVLIGPVHEVDRLAGLPVGEQPSLALVPFRQIAERGFDVRDDGTPLAVLVAEESWELPLDEVLARLPAHDVRVEDGAFDVPDGEYADIVRRVIEDEIGQGEGANFVIRRTFEGRSRASAGPTRWRCSGGCWPVSGARTGPSSCTPGAGRWSAPVPRCMCGCPAGPS